MVYHVILDTSLLCHLYVLQLKLFYYFSNLNGYFETVKKKPIKQVVIWLCKGQVQNITVKLQT